jgi:hypothetical protein
MRTKGLEPAVALRFVQSKRPVVNPNVGFRRQLMLYWRLLGLRKQAADPYLPVRTVTDLSCRFEAASELYGEQAVTRDQDTPMHLFDPVDGRDGLFIGSLAAAGDPSVLRRGGITDILNCTGSPRWTGVHGSVGGSPINYGTYCPPTGAQGQTTGAGAGAGAVAMAGAVAGADADADLVALEAAVAWVRDAARKSGRKVLIHDDFGYDGAAVVATAVVMACAQTPAAQALRFLQIHRCCANPKPAGRALLMRYDAKLTRERCAADPRMARLVRTTLPSAAGAAGTPASVPAAPASAAPAPARSQHLHRNAASFPRGESRPFLKRARYDFGDDDTVDGIGTNVDETPPPSVTHNPGTGIHAAPGTDFYSWRGARRAFALTAEDMLPPVPAPLPAPLPVAIDPALQGEERRAATETLGPIIERLREAGMTVSSNVTGESVGYYPTRGFTINEKIAYWQQRRNLSPLSPHSAPSDAVLAEWAAVANALAEEYRVATRTRDFDKTVTTRIDLDDFNDILRHAEKHRSIAAQLAGGAHPFLRGLTPTSAIDTNQRRDMEEIRVPINQIGDRLCLGNAAAAEDLTLLRIYGITHVVNACDSTFELHPSLSYLSLNLRSTADANTIGQFDRAAQWIDETLSKSPQNKVFIHCFYGISPGASVAIAYFMRTRLVDAFSAYHFVRSKRLAVDPQPSFRFKLVEYEQQIKRTLAPGQKLGNLQALCSPEDVVSVKPSRLCRPPYSMVPNFASFGAPLF